MSTYKITSIDNTKVTLQHTYTLEIENEYQLLKLYYEDIINVVELDCIKTALFPDMTAEQFNKLAEQICNELNEY